VGQFERTTFCKNEPPEIQEWLTPSEGSFEMEQFNRLMEFVRDTRDQQQRYLETIRTDNLSLIEKYRNESIILIKEVKDGLVKTTDQIRDDLAKFMTETKQESGSVRRWYMSTIITILVGFGLGFGAIVFSIWATAPKH
jgi:hypothetical protein